MAVYGINPATGVATNGQVPFTGWSPTLGSGPANVGATNGYAAFNGLMQNDYNIMYNMTGASNRGILAVIKALTGIATGGTVSNQYSRVQGQNPSAVGVVPIETKVTVPSRSTTAADASAILALWNRTVNPTPYVNDLTGNGGGGQLWFIGVK
jgi:hypothetical protein